MQNILVTGGGGYIGTVLCEELLRLGYNVFCLDQLFFGKEAVAKPQEKIKIIQDDIRFVSPRVFKDIDVVIDLAGLPNDPACDLNPAFTEDVNYRGSLRIAQLALQAGVKRFIYSSSCSVYGAGVGRSLKEGAALNPVSLYAKTKIRMEIELCRLACSNFCVTVLRNATVYGVSPCMRFDLLVNLMVAHAVKKQKIYVLGGGKQLRPIVHVRDVCRAFVLALTADSEKVNGEVFNVGTNEQNYQVDQVANTIQEIISGTAIEVVPDGIEKRSYHVNFDKIQNLLGFKEKHVLSEGIDEIKQALERGTICFDDIKTIRVDYYRHLLGTCQIPNEIKRELLPIIS